MPTDSFSGGRSVAELEEAEIPTLITPQAGDSINIISLREALHDAVKDLERLDRHKIHQEWSKRFGGGPERSNYLGYIKQNGLANTPQKKEAYEEMSEAVRAYEIARSNLERALGSGQ